MSIGATIVGLSMLWALPAWSCSAGMTNAWMKPIKPQDDCSVENLGRGVFGHGDATPAQDLGNGMSSQVVSFGPTGCTVTEVLVVTDCATRNNFLAPGVTETSVSDGPGVFVAGGDYTAVKYIMPPYGPIDLSDNVSIEKLVAIAEKNDLGYSLDRHSLWREAGIKHFDTYCGCKLFYPDLPGDAK